MNFVYVFLTFLLFQGEPAGTAIMSEAYPTMSACEEVLADFMELIEEQEEIINEGADGLPYSLAHTSCWEIDMEKEVSIRGTAI